MGGCGTTAGWKTSPYVHLLLGGKPQASCTPHSGLPGRAKNFELFYHQDLDAIIIGLCLWNGGTHTGIITNKVEFNFKIISELNSVHHMTEKVSRCI